MGFFLLSDKSHSPLWAALRLGCNLDSLFATPGNFSSVSAICGDGPDILKWSNAIERWRWCGGDEPIQSEGGKARKKMREERGPHPPTRGSSLLSPVSLPRL